MIEMVLLIVIVVSIIAIIAIVALPKLYKKMPSKKEKALIRKGLLENSTMNLQEAQSFLSDMFKSSKVCPMCDEAGGVYACRRAAIHNKGFVFIMVLFFNVLYLPFYLLGSKYYYCINCGSFY